MLFQRTTICILTFLIAFTVNAQDFIKRTKLVIEVIQAVVDSKDKIEYMKFYGQKLYEERETGKKITKSKTLLDLTSRYTRWAQLLNDAPSFEDAIKNKKIITVTEINCPNKATAINQASALRVELDKSFNELSRGHEKLIVLAKNLPILLQRVKWMQQYFTANSKLPIVGETFGMLFYDAIQLETAIKRLRDAAQQCAKSISQEQVLINLKISNLNSNIDLIRNMQCIYTFSTNSNSEAEFNYAAKDGCKWQGKFTAINLSVKIDLTTNTILSSSLNMKFNERKLNVCGYATIPDNLHRYELRSKGGAGVYTTIEFRPFGACQPGCSVRFNAKILQTQLEGQLLIDRTDIPHDPGINFHVVKELILLRN